MSVGVAMGLAASGAVLFAHEAAASPGDEPAPQIKASRYYQESDQASWDDGFQSFMFDCSGYDFNVAPLSKNTSPLLAAAMTLKPLPDAEKLAKEQRAM